MQIFPIKHHKNMKKTTTSEVRAEEMTGMFYEFCRNIKRRDVMA